MTTNLFNINDLQKRFLRCTSMYEFKKAVIEAQYLI